MLACGATAMEQQRVEKRSQGRSTSGSALSLNVSPVSARLGLPIAQMSPATTAGAGRCCLPSGNDSAPMRSSSS